MDAISVFDMFKVGIGPSSSHTLGPWWAGLRFVDEVKAKGYFLDLHQVQVHLYGSLALTGHGHGTDIALMMGLSGFDPRNCELDKVNTAPENIYATKHLSFGGEKILGFDPERDLIFHFDQQLNFHANGLCFKAHNNKGDLLHELTIFSVGGGFILTEEENNTAGRNSPPCPIETAQDLAEYCISENASIWEIVINNERHWFGEDQIKEGLNLIWETMESSVYRGCHTQGILPGGLRVKRRAAGIHKNLMGPDMVYKDRENWIKAIRQRQPNFSQILRWIGCFAMAVNEENANFGRIVTSPTNGSAGVIPAVMMYYQCFIKENPTVDDRARFLLTAGEIGSIFKKGATISAAMGGCQAEIGVSSAMAAAGLTELMGGSVGQILMAAEIAMEHHLGLTCDPIGGLVQVPCIERNSMGAIKAITAAEIAMESDPSDAVVSLDKVVQTMWETAQDMHTKYKETSRGGLATKVSIVLPEC